jgi:hypothetical protein
VASRDVECDRVYRHRPGYLLGGISTAVVVAIDLREARNGDILADTDDMLAVRGRTYSDRSGGCDKMGPCLFFQPHNPGLLFSILGIRIRPFH